MSTIGTHGMRLLTLQQSFLNKEASSVIIPLDLREYNTFEELTKKAINAFGKIDILIKKLNNI